MARVKALDDLLVEELRTGLAVEQATVPLLSSFLLDVDDCQLANGLRRHRAETEEHVRNVASALRILGAEAVAGACPALDGLRREHELALGTLDPQARPEIKDLVVAGSGARIEAYELALYESIVPQAELLGEDDVAELLGRNLESERAMLDQDIHVAGRLAREVADTQPSIR